METMPSKTMNIESPASPSLKIALSFSYGLAFEILETCESNSPGIS